MKTALLLSGLIVALFIPTGCKKDTITYTITGIVKNYSSNAPLAGATVKLIVTGAGNGSASFEQSVVSGSDGSYSFTFDRSKIENVKVTMKKDGYFDYERSFTLEDLSFDEPNEVELPTHAKSWVRLHFVSDGTKSLKYFKQVGLNGCSECCPTAEVQVIQKTDTSIYCINNGNALYQIQYFIIGTPLNGIASVTTVSNDTTELLVNY